MNTRLERIPNSDNPDDSQVLFESYVEGEEVDTITVSRDWWEENGEPDTIEVAIEAIHE